MQTEDNEDYAVFDEDAEITDGTTVSYLFHGLFDLAELTFQTQNGGHKEKAR